MPLDQVTPPLIPNHPRLVTAFTMNLSTGDWLLTGDQWTSDVSRPPFRAWAHAGTAELTPRVWARWRVLMDESKTMQGRR